jgi:hypothetical protein
MVVTDKLAVKLVDGQEVIMVMVVLAAAAVHALAALAAAAAAEVILAAAVVVMHITPVQAEALLLSALQLIQPLRN